jgi:peptidoglycan/xylan/chitin deacetylase (PgdA/CDA1 family)
VPLRGSRNAGAGLAVLTLLTALAALTSGCGSAGKHHAAQGGITGTSRAPSTGSPGQPGQPGSTLPGSSASRPVTQGPGGSVASLPPPPKPPAGRPVAESGPLPPAVYRIPTSQRVVFLGIDDGATKDPAFLALVQRLHIPFTAFLTDDEVRSDYGFFRQLQQAGVTIQDHTLTHPQLNHRSLAAQKREICGAADRYAQVFGKRPVLLRPPYGSYNLDTRRAAKACGMRALVNWDVSLPATKLRFANGSKLRPGDIILTHFRPTLLRDIVPVLAQIEREGFTIGRLEDYV